MYNDTDKVHYDYFDYLDEDDAIHQYEPDSDMDFVDFKAKMKEEWNTYKSSLTSKQNTVDVVNSKCGFFCNYKKK